MDSARERSARADPGVYDTWTDVVRVSANEAHGDGKAALEAWNAAIQKGLTEETLRETLGPKPDGFYQTGQPWHSTLLGQGGGIGSRNTLSFESEVVKMTPVGKGKVELRFPQQVSRNKVLTNCWQTNRIERIDDDGYVVYEEECTGAYRTEKTVLGRAPVRIPASEAKHVTVGSRVRVSVWKNSREGRVTMVRHEGKVVAVGGFAW